MTGKPSQGLKRLIVGALLLLGATTTFAQNGETSGPSGTLVIGSPTEPANLDPGRDPGGPEQDILYGVVETLLTFGQDMELNPLLAVSLPEVSPDGTTYTFKLREDVRFHDGEPMDAEAVKFSFDRVLGKVGGQPGAYVNLVAGLEEVRAVDPYTVTFHLASPSATFLNNITHIQFAIISPTAYSQLGEAFARGPVGTGPFRVENWVRGQQIQLLANESYWDSNLPRSSSIVFRFLPDSSTRIIALESGEIDIALAVPETDFERLERNSRVQLFNAPTLRTVFFMLQPNLAPMNDLAVREAFSLAINIEGIADQILEDLHLPAIRATFNPTVWGVTENVALAEFDLDRANEILDDAGWARGPNGIRQKAGQPLRFTLWTTTGRYPRDSLIGQYVGQTLREIGMDATVQTMEWAAYREQLYNNEMAAFLFGAGSSTGDIDFVASALFNPSSRFSQTDIPEITQLLVAAQTEIDPDARKALYDEAFNAIFEARLWVPIYWQSTLVAAGDSVKGLQVHPTERIDFKGAYK